MRRTLIVLGLLLGSITPAAAQVSVGISAPGISIGIDVPVYPDLVRVPGYPVYYAPQVNSNYFFYDGMYWVYQEDNWYASSWYNGPWELVSPDAVPLFILRVPVRYYREPPSYFRGWASNSPPRWGDHWGNSWQQQRRGWDSWNHSAVPAPAPLPVYQRQYSGTRYPRAEQQQAALETQNYHYQPHEAVVQQRFQAQRAQAAAPASSAQETHRAAQPKTSTQQAERGASPSPSHPQVAATPRGQAPQKGGEDQRKPAVAKAPVQHAPTVQAERKQSQQVVAQHQQQAAKPQAKAPTQKPKAEPQRRSLSK